jgi:hypothetical protein
VTSERLARWSLDRYFLLRDGLCESALPAADLDARLVLPSRRTFDAALAAVLEVDLPIVPNCDIALPAEVLEVGDVDLLRSVADAALAAFGPVVFLLAILLLLLVQRLTL